MSNDYENDIKRLCSAIDDWLRPDNSELKQAIDKTVEKQFFSFEDIKHQVRVLKKTLNEDQIREWIDRNRPLNFTVAKKSFCFCMRVTFRWLEFRMRLQRS